MTMFIGLTQVNADRNSSGWDLHTSDLRRFQCDSINR